MGVQTPRVILSVLRAFRWHRRWFAAIFAAIAVAAGANTLTAHSSGSVPVVVLTRSLPGGSVLAGGDLSVAWLPPAAAPEGAFSATSELIGKELLGAATARTPVTGADLLTHNAAVAAGKVALPVKFGETTDTRLLAVGSHIDVLGSAGSGQAFATVAGDIRVVAMPDAAAGGAFTSAAPQLVMVEVDPSQAAAIATAAAAGSLSYALR